MEALLNGSSMEKKQCFNYEFKVYRHFASFQRDMYQKESEVGLTRMIAGYAWEWVSKSNAKAYDITLEGISRKWNHCTEGWVHTKEAIDEIGCIHSIQGYDLNYAFVIIGEDIGYDPKEKKIIVRPEQYFDKNGKRTASYEELLEYIRNIYYVLMTRGIKGTYLYVYDNDLREYFEQYIDTMEE